MSDFGRVIVREPGTQDRGRTYTASQTAALRERVLVAVEVHAPAGDYTPAAEVRYPP